MSPDSPLATLVQAQDVVRSIWATEPTTSIVVKIAPGTYLGQSVQWTSVNPNASLSIEAQNAAQRPVFDGERKVVAGFFRLSYSAGPSNLTLRSLHIKRYLSGVLLTGIRENFSQFNSNNAIIDCIFEQIGNASWPVDSDGKRPAASSALGLTTSTSNLISGNKFIDIKNDYEPGSMHAIYLAHGSSNNEVSGNEFKGDSGSPIRLRDYSNDNLVTGNEFNDSDQEAVETWFCDDANRSGCTKKDECPNLNLKVERNIYSNAPGIFEDTVPYDPTKTHCLRSIPDTSATLAKNVDVTNGRCLIRSMKGCPFFSLPAQTFVPDYLSQEAQGNAAACELRAQSYYGSCTSRTGDLNDVMTTRMQTTSPGLYYDAHRGSGCLTQAENCDGMDVPQRGDVLDRDPNSQQKKEVCLGRVSTWYKSCGPDSPDSPIYRFNRQKFIAGQTEELSVAGHGCVIHANFCPRMGIEENGFRMDGLTEASHTNAQVCVDRARTWWSSCTKYLTNPSTVKVEARFYQNGSLVRSQSYP